MASRIDSSESDRTPLLATSNDARFRRERGNMPIWRHILENKMTWAWYNVVIGSGAVAMLIYNLPHHPHKTWVIGAVVYLISLVLFLAVLLTHVVRFLVRPALLPASMKHPLEGLHVPAMPTALGILILNGATYAEKMHHNDRALRGFYWLFIVLALIFGVGSPLLQFSKSAHNRLTKPFSSDALNAVLPLLLAGPTAAVALAHLPTAGHHGSALGIMSFGVALQGMGFFLSLLYQASVLSRLHNDGLPAARERPALFINSIPAALTAWGAVGLAQQALRHFAAAAQPGGDSQPVVGGVALYYVGVALALVFWGLAVWWFLVAAGACFIGAMGMRGESECLEGYMVVFAHAAVFLASNELLRAFQWPRGLTLLNEVLGVFTLVVWAALVLGGLFGVATGRFVRD
ncbi:voltage-dependent anion channel [Sphaerosporella brunnea]|uniref:Voltage-dependent anion channel n=1 Tax=Sphaerosporella brunnea TaxID=1250544 RepID=A0A5J5F0J8_9PEZI|nr:voltage-dependent anion channel [Sphaerosporella brunnea]